MTPTFLSLAEALEIHEDQLARYGGAPGLRSMPLLESALAQPQATFDGNFLLTDLFEMAAAYLFHLVQNHPFVDGNKRVGAVAAIRRRPIGRRARSGHASSSRGAAGSQRRREIFARSCGLIGRLSGN